jgi:hypothetical protein
MARKRIQSQKDLSETRFHLHCLGRRTGPGRFCLLV